MASSLIISGMTSVVQYCFPKVTSTRELKCMVYDGLSYYVYNGAFLIGAVMGVAIPIFALLGGVFRFSTAFWFLLTAYIVRKEVFQTLVLFEIYKVAQPPQLDDRKSDEGKSPKPLEKCRYCYLSLRLQGILNPEQEHAKNILLAHEYNPKEHSDWMPEKKVFGIRVRTTLPARA